MQDANQFSLVIGDRQQLVSKAEAIYKMVWRVDFTAPGFAVLNFPPDVDSYSLRSAMILLKHQLSEVGTLCGRGRFGYSSMGRFDQQNTTKFHLDGASEQSLLMLGYEPSNVVSRLFLADYTRAASDLRITPQQFLQDFNPIFSSGESQLARYVTELPPAQAGCSRMLLINNSSLHFQVDRMNPLGVMHKASITPNQSEHRIVNSIMLAAGEQDQNAEEMQRDFLTTDKISQKAYDIH